MDSQHPPSFCSSTPHFFQMILNDNCKQKLKIPKKFAMKYGKELSSSVCLKLPSGSEWEVGLIRCHGKIWFEKGWPDFSVFYSLDHGHFLVFRYEGNSHFHVCICDLSTTEIDYPVTIPKIEEADEDDDLSVEILEGFSPTPKRREKSPSPCPPRKKMRTSSLSKEGMISEGEDDANGGSTGSTKFLKQTSHQAIAKALAFQRANDIKSGNPSFIISMQKSDIQTSLSLPWMFAERHLMKQPTCNIILRISDGRTWPVEFTYTKQKALFQSGWLTFVKDNNLKVGDACVFLLIKDIKLVLEVILFLTSEASHLFLSKAVNVSNNRDARDLKQAHHEVLTTLKPLTANEKDDAFKSDKPSVSITMPQSSIDRNFLSFPNEFTKRYLMKLPACIAKIQVPDRRTWSVKFKYDHANSRARLQKGWSSFVRDNNLKVGDACVFTLIDCIEVLFEVDISPTEGLADCPLSTGAAVLAENRRSPMVKAEQECNMNTVPCSEIGKNKISRNNGKVTQRPPSPLRVNVEAADNFASENPFFRVTLGSWNFENRTVHVPANFAKSSIKLGKQKVNLQVKDRSWPVNLIKFKSGCMNSICGGWPAFSKANCLKEGDVCIFELMEMKDIVLEVHIFRC